jgi:Na+/proline symporter
MRRVLIYILIFPPVAAAYIFAVQRINPLKGDLWLVLLSVYATCFFPAVFSAWTHDALRHRGYRSIPSVFVGMITLPAWVYFFLGIRDPRLLAAYGIAGLLGALCCWVISRLGQQNQPPMKTDPTRDGGNLRNR